ncbi:MAG: hypothetical protein GX102_01240 [Porphyromonadaceae bacterium]|nr:hypothetical protein [Porphyromonadaceae bacterium]
MKKIKYILTLVIPFIFFSCWDNCREMQYSAPNEIAESYCKNMIPGNYWIYSNQDNTKIDSLYYTYVPGEKQGEYIVKKMCAGWYQKVMKLHSTFFSETQLDVSYRTGGVDGFTYLSIGNKEFKNSFLLEFYPDKEKCKAHFLGEVLKMNYINEFKVGNNFFQDVILLDNTYILAPDIGIVQYVSYNQIDTFYFKKNGYEKNNY